MRSTPATPLRPRLLFCSYHGYLDLASGAALSTRDLLELLAANGWDCAVLCGPESDSRSGAAPDALLRGEGVNFQYRPGEVAGVPCTLYHGGLNGVSVHAFVPAAAGTVRPPSQEEGQAFLELFGTVQARFRPDVLLTYGGQWLAFPLLRRARQKGAKAVFALHNLEYNAPDLFREVDAVLVPSQAARDHYLRLGVETTAIPGPFRWERVLCREVQGRHVTFVNPQPYKGVCWLAAIAQETARRRPDVPFLVVEGRGVAGWLARCGLGPSGLPNLRWRPATADPREFYRTSRAVLMPSLCQEAFGRVAAEAMMNGIPVLASRRGGLSEALNGAGFLFDVPDRYGTHSTEVPTAEEVAPWVEVILRLFDDEAFHREQGERCRQAAQAWLPERLLPRFDSFFRELLVAPG